MDSENRNLEAEDWPDDLTPFITRTTQDPVSGGAFGDVWKCNYNANSDISTFVAVKAFRFPKDYDLKRINRKIAREIGILTILRHNNIVPLLGTVTGFGWMPALRCLVTPWIPNGTLNAYLASNHNDLTALDRLRMTKDVAAGLCYLHSVLVVHGDITGVNILIDEGGRARLIDFGLSTIVRPLLGQSHLAATSIHAGAIRYAAPELVLSDDVRGLPLEKTDIYSFGCVMLQILSGRHPWSEIESEKPELRILMMIVKGRGPQRPNGHPVIIDSDWDIIQRCLLSRPELRPSADEVLDLVGARMQPRNFVIFGEMGVGKSELVNLIAGQQLAESSSGAKLCTLQSTEYQIRISDLQLNVNLFDTPGLGSPTMNNAGYLDALVKAHELVVSLKSRGGVHGLLFCIKAGRLSNTIQQNYRLFFEFLCQEQVPLALVVTGLENEENMDNFWTNNKGYIEQSGIVPVTHVCITTIKGYGNVYEAQDFESRKKVLKMLQELGSLDACLVDVKDWFARMREFLIPAKRLRRSRQKMLQMLMRRCELHKEDAIRLLERIEADENWSLT